MTGATIDPGRFVASVQPLLEAKDLEGLLCHLKRHYQPDKITALLSCPDCDVKLRRTPALRVGGLVQCPRCSLRFPVPPEPEDAHGFRSSGRPSTSTRK